MGLNSRLGMTSFGGLVSVTGTLISAVLLLFRQRWRMAINRSAEAMTIFLLFKRVYFQHGASMVAFLHTESIWFFVGEL
jgi:molybdopterin-containing oxidoreductase family membrane subunit